MFSSFFTGAPSAPWDKENPDYVPSLFNFPNSHRTEGEATQKLDRYNRLKARAPLGSLDVTLIDIIDDECEEVATECEQVNNLLPLIGISEDGMASQRISEEDGNGISEEPFAAVSTQTETVEKTRYVIKL